MPGDHRASYRGVGDTFRGVVIVTDAGRVRGFECLHQHPTPEAAVGCARRRVITGRWINQPPMTTL